LKRFIHLWKIFSMNCILSCALWSIARYLTLTLTLCPHRSQVLDALSSLLDHSCSDSAGDTFDPQAALGPALEAISEWILEPCRRFDDRCRSPRTQHEVDGRNGASADAMTGKGERNIGLAGYLFGVAYNAGLNLLTGNFSSLAIGSDAEDETQVHISLLYWRSIR
jgi:hypothetical protein